MYNLNHVTVFVGDLQNRDDLHILSDYQDTTRIKLMHPIAWKEYDSFMVNQDESEIWGFYGNTAYLYKRIYLLQSERMNRMAYNQLSNYATTVSTHGNFTEVIYHSTIIVKWNLDSIILDSAGFKTRTTKMKMNQAANQFNLGYSVYQVDFIWFVEFHGQTIPFRDGMILKRLDWKQ